MRGISQEASDRPPANGLPSEGVVGHFEGKTIHFQPTPQGSADFLPTRSRQLHAQMPRQLLTTIGRTIPGAACGLELISITNEGVCPGVQQSRSFSA